MRVPLTAVSAGMSAAVIEEKTMHFSRAREARTLRRRSPPSLDTGPNWRNGRDWPGATP